MKLKLLISTIFSVFAIMLFAHGVFAESLDEVDLERLEKAILEGDLEFIENNQIFSTDPGGSGAAKYPGTSVVVRAGDVIYSPKNSSTFFAGHVAIVGSDYKIYHSTPATSTGRAKDSVTGYFNRYNKGDSFTVLRPKSSSNANKAATMAQGVYNLTERYAFHPELNNFASNYCSKFVWQAFYYGGAGDILNKGYSRITSAYILPSEILNASTFSKVVSFKK